MAENRIQKSWCWLNQGESGSLILKEKDIQALGDTEVLIKNNVIGLNPVDWKLIERGHSDWKAGHTPGVDAMGIIIATGKKMKHLRIGSRVCYHTDLSKDGSFSTHTIVPGHALMHVPDKVSDEAAASFPCPSLTAWQAFKKSPSMRGCSVLISGAGGSVGYTLTQLLIETGAKVYVTASPKHHAEFKQMGVIDTFDYKDPTWKDKAISVLSGNLFDTVFDTVSGTHAQQLAPLLAYYGHLVTVQDRIKQAPLPAFTSCISLHEVALGAIHKYGSVQQITQLMYDGEQLLVKVGNGTLRLREHTIANFDNLPEHLVTMKVENSQIKYLIRV